MKTLSSLIENHREGWTLEQDFFTRDDIFAADVKHIWKKQWLFAGFTAQIPKSGDFFVYNLFNESVIIIRGEKDQIYAHHNSCRHRGSTICKEETGHAKQLVCPYHSWAYKKDGSLRAARLMPEDFDKSEYGLQPVKLKILEGLIFISLSENPPSFQQINDDFAPFLRPFKFENAKVGHRSRLELHGNWKLFIQNFRECYHCGTAHPEYCNAVVGANYMEDDKRDEHWEKSKRNWSEKGLASETVEFKEGTSHFAIRYPLREGVQSYSLDGSPVSIPMGDHKDYDNGVVGLVKLPNFCFDCVSDYTWAMRITPKDATHCTVDIIFLVDGNAVEGVDYQLDKLTKFWDITAGQDWELIRNSQIGIESSQYRQGPYSLVEKEVSDFDMWYISELKGAGK